MEKTQDLIILVVSELMDKEHENKVLKEHTQVHTQGILQKFLAKELDLKSESSSMLITRCQRPSAKKSCDRPIMTGFAMDSDRRNILNQKYMLISSGFSIRDDLPGQIVSG